MWFKVLIELNSQIQERDQKNKQINISMMYFPSTILESFTGFVGELSMVKNQAISQALNENQLGIPLMGCPAGRSTDYAAPR